MNLVTIDGRCAKEYWALGSPSGVPLLHLLAPAFFVLTVNRFDVSSR